MAGLVGVGAGGLILRDDFEDRHARTSMERREHRFELWGGGLERRANTIPM